MNEDEKYLSEFRKPIQNFIRKLKENGKLSVLEAYERNAGMKSDARRKSPDNEEETFRYYLPLLCRILGNYANNNFYHQKAGYYDIPFTNKHIHYSTKNYNQIAQRIEAVFRSSKNTPSNKESRMFVAYTLYSWCNKNNLSDILRDSFIIDSTASSDITIYIYNELINTASEIHPASEKPDSSFNALFLLPNSLDRIETKEYVKKVRKLLSVKTGWSINSDLLKALITVEPIDKRKVQSKLKKIAGDILKEAEKHPLYTYLIEREHYDELRELLKLTSSYNEQNSVIAIMVKPPIRQIIQQISDWYDKKPREYTKYTLLEAAGSFANSACGDKHWILREEVINSLARNEAAQLYRTIYHDLETGDFKWITGGKFSIRQYRLVFWALGSAIKYNRELNRPEQIWENIQCNFQRFIEPLSDSEHINWRFDDIICFTTALLHRLDYSIKIPFIEMLCTYTYDFSVRNRPRQELAIHILTYLLCEDQDLPHDLRTKVFLSTYGQAMYKIQHNEWAYIDSSSTFYSDFARRYFLEACELIDSRYAKKQPHFFFLYGYLNPEIDFDSLKDLKDVEPCADDFLKYAAYIQAQSWFQGDIQQNCSLIKEKLKLLIEYAHGHLTALPDNNILKYVYGSNLLCYAISNLCANDKDFKISTLATGRILLETIIYTDFYSRYYNAAYNNAKYFENPPYSFMLNGSFRVVCSRSFNNTVVTLDKEMLRLYERWFRFETGRYKILMLRLLSYTNFFDELDEAVKNELLSEAEAALPETAFLAYDHIPDSTEERKRFFENLKAKKAKGTGSSTQF